MKHNFRKITLSIFILFYNIANSQPLIDPEVINCTAHTDSEYAQLIVGKWQLAENLNIKNNSFTVRVEYGATGMVKLTILNSNNNIDNQEAIYDEAYGYFDIKSGVVSATFYNESNSAVGLADGTAYKATFSCMCHEQQVIIIDNISYTLNKI
jgi:hypothetical protein